MKPVGPLFIFILLNLFIANAQEHKNWTWGGPIDPLQEKITIEHYELDLELIPEEQAIQGFLKVTFDCVEKLDTLRLNLVQSYKVTQVEIYDEPAKYRHFGDTLDIYIEDGCAGEAKVHYEGKPPIAINPPWEGGFTWEKDGSGNHWMGLSSQNEGAKIFMPCLDHPSSEPSMGIDLYLTAPAPYFIAANGRLVSQERKGEKISYHWSSSYPINNYNINFTLGVFHEESKTYHSIAGNDIPLNVYTLEENKEKAPLLLAVLENSVKTQEKFFGEFPFPNDKIAVVETPYLGMEHQTINAYGNNFQFVKMGEVFYDWLLHHELGHEWWGNKVSVADWADFWLHEGLCTYADWLFFQEHGGRKTYLEKVNEVEKTLQHSYPVVAPKNSTSDEAYHPEIYSKGAFIIHSLRYLLGDELFFPMLKAFVTDEQYTYTNLVETKDFTEFVQQYSELDLEDFFQVYLYTTTIPKVKISKKGKHRYAVSFSNIDLSLPIDILTSKGRQRIKISSKPTVIKSDSPITVDPEGWYLLQ